VPGGSEDIPIENVPIRDTILVSVSRRMATSRQDNLQSIKLPLLVNRCPSKCSQAIGTEVGLNSDRGSDARIPRWLLKLGIGKVVVLILTGGVLHPASSALGRSRWEQMDR